MVFILYAVTRGLCIVTIQGQCYCCAVIYITYIYICTFIREKH